MLVDSFRRAHTYLRISLTERCNLRCRYCMPEDGIPLTPHEGLLRGDEIRRLVGVFGGMGIVKVRLTGGEPLLFRGLEDLCRDIRAVPTIKRLTMTTNGVTLGRCVAALKDAGMTGVNVSLDTLREERFEMIARRRGHRLVVDGLQLAERVGFETVKVNCVMMRGVNDDELVEFARMTQHRDLEVRFIEYMPFEKNGWSRAQMLPFMEAMDIIEKGVGLPLKFVGNGETAKLFQIDGYRGRIGFISSMTTHFCGTCNRLRLTADGHLKTCLFGDEEVSLLDPMRKGATDAELQDIILKAVMRKHFSHGGKNTPEDLAASTKRPMVHIGG